MRDPFLMVVAIVAILTIGQIIKAKMGIRRDRGGREYDAVNAQENAQLRDEIKALKDRIHTLERIATDSNRAVDLDREIERLR